MSEDPQQPDAPAAPATEPAHPPPARRRRLRLWLLRLLALGVAVVAGTLVSLFTVDLGPLVRERAEREGSKYLERPMRIGRLSAKLRPGEFLVENLVIEGLKPGDRPFLAAKRIAVKVPWWTVFNRQLIIEAVEMTDWKMVIETLPGGRHNFPRFVRPSQGPPRPRPFTTTLRSVLASRGELVYDDHGTPWSVATPDLRVELYRNDAANNYRGRASFGGGAIKIQSYEQFRAAMRSEFTMTGSHVHFDRIDLDSDGATSVITGDVDLGRWPEQLYRIRSVIDFPTQKEIFFHGQKFAAFGTGNFDGTFHLFKGGRELKGSFRSAVAGVNDWRFPNLRGSVLWLPDRLDITDATSDFSGGTARFDYRMAPFGQRDRPARAVWDVDYRDVDLAQVTDALETEGVRLSGRATGTNRLEWPLGKWAQKTGRGVVTVAAPAGTRVATREMPGWAAERAALPAVVGPFNSREALGRVPMSGRLVYALDPEWLTFDQSWVATDTTYVEFGGRTAFGERSRIPFHVTSADWQESDRLLAGIMTAFGAPTGAVPIGGYGEFDGVLLGAFRRPRVEGTFTGEALRAWDVVWGRGSGQVTIENSYVQVSNASMSVGDARISADGRFSLGFPRRDGGDEIDATVRVTRWPLADLRRAFSLDDYPVGGLTSGEYQLYGNYQTPSGFGRLLIEQGTAYGERFDTAAASLRFEGTGVRLDGLDIRKGSGGITGTVRVGWDGAYSFNADGAKIPVDALDATAFPTAPLSGILQFSSTGVGTFDDPRYDVKLRVDDLFAGDEGIGQLTGRLSLRSELMTVELEAASPRLVASGSGRIALTPALDSELTVRFDASLDPYLRFFEPRLSPFTTAVAAGTVRVVGPLSDVDELMVDTRLERVDLKLFDYALENEGPIELLLDRSRVHIGRLTLAGEGTRLSLAGGFGLRVPEIAVEASGDANLGILQGFFRDIRSRGTARIKAQITGSPSKPLFSGNATIADGRIRHFSLPHSLESINGEIAFDGGGVQIDGVRGRLGGGDVEIGGRIGLVGFAPGNISLTAVGSRMAVRYPEGFRSVVNADLSLHGTTDALVLDGSVAVQDALWSRRIEANPELFSFSGGSGASIAPSPSAPAIPLRFDLDITSDASVRIQNNIANLVASADLKLQGTYDRPLLFGRAEIDRGDIVFEGNRYIVSPGGSIDFYNPSRIEPFFDIEAETRVRLPGQTYRVTIGLSGTANRIAPTLNSDPPLPEVDIIALLFGQTVDVNNAELRALNPNATQESEEVLLRQGMARLLTSPIAAPVSRVLGETFGIDSVQITPSLGSESDQITPSARVIIGKRISNRAYLTFARALGASSSQSDQVVILEYDQNDRLGWVVTQNGDGTFALDFRVRRRF